MTHRLNRRTFLGSTAAAGAFLAGAPAFARDQAANEKINLAFVGVANKGGHNVEQLKGLPDVNIVALCDVDSNYLDRAAASFPKATKYRDYRKMFDTEAKNIDGVVVSTADHTHAGPTAIGLTLGKHVYCEKPMTHTVTEARHMAKLARANKVATQMGTQIHAGDNYRRVVEIIQAGVIGPVKQVYNWCNKGWSDGRFVATDKPVPANLDWDLWLGPAKQRKYSPNIHPANWRRFWEYGSGTFGDMACHVMDLPFWALELRHPTRVEAKGPPIHPDGAPSWVLAKYDFPARGNQPAVEFFWSDGGHHHDLVRETRDLGGKPLSSWGLGILFVGEKGMLAADYGRNQLLPKDKFEKVERPTPTIPKSMGHWKEWIHACKTGAPTTCNFDYSGALTETVLLGVAAFRAGQPLEWDGAALRVKNTRAADEFLTKEYRKGFEIAGM